MEEKQEIRLHKETSWNFAFPSVMPDVDYRDGKVYFRDSDKEVLDYDLKMAGGVKRERWVSDWRTI